ncbi:MAG TPA: response regulator [Kofleriaceae bacterium]|nr:response regulator [Kofleriaceae bacterium]
MGSILLVESDPETRDRLGLVMREAGHEVLVAITPREAFLRVSEGGIDAVVVDSYDPRVGVIDLAKNFDALPDAPPVVLVSASPHAPEISARIGAAAFLPKPLDPGELVNAISRLVGEVRPVRQIDASMEDFAAGDEEPTGPVRISSLR